MEGSGKRIIIVVVGAAIFFTCIIFAIPFNTVPYQENELYKDTEIQQQPYTATESYISRELREKEETIFDGTPYSVPHGISVPFSVSKTNARLVGSYRLPAPGGFYLYLSAGKIAYEERGIQGNIDIPLSKGEYEVLLRESISWKDKVYLNLKLKWSELDEVTKYKEVTKYREVPVTVEKQRTITKYKNVSLWEIVFRN